jgi:cobalt-zinc-cadmium efflux system outer membrane protein
MKDFPVIALGIAGAAAASLLLAGCKGVPTAGERQAREQVRTLTELYRPAGKPPELPKLTTNSSLADLLRFALLNQPQVEAAYFDWAAAVEQITVERSLPDPQFTFQMDIASVVTSVMPGLMQALPAPGKLRLSAQVATAESQAKYFAFEDAVLQTAEALKRAFFQLHFLDEKLRVDRATLRLLADLEQIARAQNEVGKVTLQDVLRAQIERDRMATEIVNLEDSRGPLLALFKAALGLRDDQAAPPVAQRLESTPLDVTADQLFATALALNPRLKGMEADVRRAEASLALARKARLPESNFGFMADAQTSPTLYRLPGGPATVSLPIWRDKIAAEIAAAQAAKRAAAARLTAEQINLAADFATTTFAYREAERNLALLQGQLLPKASQSLTLARGGYLSGQIGFFNLIDAERTLLNFQLEEVDQRLQRELVLARLSLIILGQPPAGAPVLASPLAAEAKGAKL